MLLVCAVTSYFHYNIWGCMCSTGPFRHRWLKGYIYSSCYYHHQIGSIHLSHCYHVCPWLCLRCLLHHILLLIAYTFRENREFVFIIIVQFMMSANNRIRFVLEIVFVCLYCNNPGVLVVPVWLPQVCLTGFEVLWERLESVWWLGTDRRHFSVEDRIG